jgi:hypothetical protein
VRGKIRANDEIEGTLVTDCLSSCCCMPCSIMQESHHLNLVWMPETLPPSTGFEDAMEGGGEVAEGGAQAADGGGGAVAAADVNDADNIVPNDGPMQ